MVKRAVLVHGTKGKRDGNWFPWLSKSLEDSGLQMLRPQFPTPENQTIEGYFKVWNKEIGSLASDDILIGHSSGPNFILRVLERQETPIKATFLVAPFVRENGDTEIDNLNRNLWGGGYDWEKIKKFGGQFFVYASDNDPYVPLKNSQEVAGLLGVKLTLVSGAGHFNLSSNPQNREFSKLLQDIRSL